MVIKEAFEEVIPETCLNQFLIWELLDCVGCNANEPYFTDHKTKTIWLCKKFVERLYSKHDGDRVFSAYSAEHHKEVNLDIPTTKFDKCGFLEAKLKYTRDENGNLVE